MLGLLSTAVTLQNTWEPHSIAPHVATRDLRSHIAWRNRCFSLPSGYESTDPYTNAYLDTEMPSVLLGLSNAHTHLNTYANQ